MDDIIHHCMFLHPYHIHRIRTILPARHHQTIGFFCKVSVKTSPDMDDILRQEIHPPQVQLVTGTVTFLSVFSYYFYFLVFPAAILLHSSKKKRLMNQLIRIPRIVSCPITESRHLIKLCDCNIICNRENPEQKNHTSNKTQHAPTLF